VAKSPVPAAETSQARAPDKVVKVKRGSSTQSSRELVQGAQVQSSVRSRGSFTKAAVHESSGCEVQSDGSTRGAYQTAELGNEGFFSEARHRSK